MAKQTRYTAQTSLQAARPALAEAGAYPVSLAPARMVGQLGQSLGQFGEIKRYQQNLQTLMQEKYQNHLDDLKTMEASDILKVASIEVDSIYENIPDPALWEDLVQAKLEEVTRKASKSMDYMSSERQDFLEKQLETYEKTEMAKLYSLRLKTVSARNQTALIAGYQQAFAEGNQEKADLMEANYLSKWRDWHGSLDEAKLLLDQTKDQGQAEFEANQVKDAKNLIAKAVNYSPGDAEDIANTYSKTFQFDESTTVEMREYALGIASHWGRKLTAEQRAKRDYQEEVISQLVQSGKPLKSIDEEIKSMTKDATERTELMRFANTERNTMEAMKVNNDKAAIEAELKVIDDAFILPQDEFLAAVPDLLKRINSSEILPVKGENGAGKEGQRKKINDRIEAIQTGKTDPTLEFDPVTYNTMVEKITKNSMSVSSTDITTPVGMGKNGGLTAAQAKDLTALKKFYDGADILGTDLHRNYSGAIIALRTSKTFSKNKAENAIYAARAMAALNAWAVKNPNATEADYQDFFNRLMDRSRMDNWSRGWFARPPEEQRIAVRENIAEFEKELGIDIKEQKGTKPKDYPDAVWNEERGIWTVIRKGRLMGIQ